MKLGVYLRVSTPRQAHLHTIEQQRDRVREYVGQHGWDWDTAHIFRDDGYSGASLNRPGLDRLREAVRMGEISQLLVTAPDRLARNYVHLMLLLEEFQQAGCTLEFLERPMSTDPHDQLLLQIRGAVAEYERALLADRMRRGRQRKYESGTLLPWTTPPYGYRVSPDRPRDPQGVWIDPSEGVCVQEMFRWYAHEGRSIYGLARHLQALHIPTPRGKVVWNPATVRGILTNPTYTGQLYVNRTRTVTRRQRRSPLSPVGRSATSLKRTEPGDWLAVVHVPAVITQEAFDLVQAKLAQNQQCAARHNTVHTYLLRALVSCGLCHLACNASARTAKYRYYTCRGKRAALQSRREHRCPSRMIPAQQLDDQVWQDLCAVLTHPEVLIAALERAQDGQWLPQELQARRETVRQAQVHLTTQLERLTDAYLQSMMDVTEYGRRRRDLEGKREALMTQAQQLEAQARHHANLADLAQGITAFCARVQAGLATATFEQKRQLVELLIDRVIVTNDQVEIRYVIPTSTAGEQSRFCHLRLDYFDAKAFAVPAPHANQTIAHV